MAAADVSRVRAVHMSVSSAFPSKYCAGMSPESFSRDGAQIVGGSFPQRPPGLLKCAAEQPTVASFDVWTAGARAGADMAACGGAVHDL